jgi:hypothetical protein
MVTERSGAMQAGSLKEACEHYAGEARKLPQAGSLVGAFQAVAQSLEIITGGAHFRR